MMQNSCSDLQKKKPKSKTKKHDVENTCSFELDIYGLTTYFMISYMSIKRISFEYCLFNYTLGQET